MAEYRGRNPRRKQDSGFSEAAVVETILSGLWELLKGIFGLIFGRGRKGSADNAALRQAVTEGWEYVELHLAQNSDALAVAEADKVFDAALQLKGVRGQTLGERLKNAEAKFPRDLYQQVWNAHKLRNRLAHEIGMQVSRQEAQLAVGTFRTAMHHLGVI